MSTPAEPRRPTPTERLHEVTMAAMLRRPSEPESSVEVTRNARGVVQIAVTVRGPDVFECEAEAIRVLDALAARYPYPAGPTNGGETT